jgi:hypothetical protein
MEKKIGSEYNSLYKFNKIDENAEEIFDRTLQKYKNIHLLRTNGVTKSIEKYKGKSKEKSKIEFELNITKDTDSWIRWKTTDNKENNYLRFNLSSSNMLVLEQNEKMVKKYERINDAIFDISSANGQSKFHILPFIFFDNKISSKYKNIRNSDDETIENSNCYKLLTDVYGVATEAKVSFIFWIEKETYLIKKVEREITYNGYSQNDSEVYTNLEIK